MLLFTQGCVVLSLVSSALLSLTSEDASRIEAGAEGMRAQHLSKNHAGCQSYTPNYASVKGLGLVLTQGRERHHDDGTFCKARTGCAVDALSK